MAARQRRRARRRARPRHRADGGRTPGGRVRSDLVGRDLTNDCVLIVENQLSATDHGHLGQLITYAAGTEARTIVWLAPVFREEHRQALDYLNALGGENASFFGTPRWPRMRRG